MTQAAVPIPQQTARRIRGCLLTSVLRGGKVSRWYRIRATWKAFIWQRVSPVSPRGFTELLTRRYVLALPLALLMPSSLRAAPPNSGVYVAVGYGGRRLRSTDGVNWDIVAEWTTNGGDDRDNLISVAYGNGTFVAVGGGVTDKNGPGGRILTSADGKDWKEHPGRKFRVHPVLFGNGRFVAGGPDYRLLWSAEGATWEAGGKIADPAATHFRMGAFGNGVFVFAGNGRRSEQEIHWVVVSKDGTAVEAERTDLPPITAMTFGSGRFVVVGPDGLRSSSADGVKWEHEVREPKVNLDSVVWTGKEFLTSGGGKGLRIGRREDVDAVAEAGPLLGATTPTPPAGCGSGRVGPGTCGVRSTAWSGSGRRR